MQPEVTVIATELAFPEGPIALPDGSILLVEIQAGRLTRVHDGVKETVAELGGGPNGAAIGPDGHCYVCNNGGFEWLERNLRPIPAAVFKKLICRQGLSALCTPTVTRSR